MERAPLGENAGLKDYVCRGYSRRDRAMVKQKLGGGAEVRFVDIGSIVHALNRSASAEKIRVAIGYMSASAIFL